MCVRVYIYIYIYIHICSDMCNRETDAEEINRKRGRRFGFVSCYSPFVEASDERKVTEPFQP